MSSDPAPQEPQPDHPSQPARTSSAALPPATPVRSHKLVSWLLGVGTFYFLICRFVPWTPPVRTSVIEESYFQVLHEAFKAHLQFGRDIVFTYGPWGFLHGGSDPATHWISVTIWTVLTMIFWWAGWRAARGCLGDGPIAWVGLFLFGAVMAAVQFFNIDPRLTAWVLLLLVLHFFAEEKPFSIAQAALAASLGLISLVKFSVFVEGGVVLALVAVDTVWRQRRFPWILPLYCASVLFFWRMGGQHWDSLAPYLRNSLRIAGGFTDAMELNASTEARDLVLFVAGAFLALAMTVYASWKKLRWFGILPVTGTAFILFSAFKYGFVRHDIHGVAATTQLLLVALAALAAANRWLPKQGPIALFIRALPPLAALCPCCLSIYLYADGGIASVLGHTVGIRSFLSPLAILAGNQPFIAEQKNYYASVRNYFPAPKVAGTVDQYPCQQLTVFAHDLTYDPRPIFQSYSAYAPELAEMNAAFLRGDHPPDNIIFSIAPIDARFPAFDDGLSWPELLSRYDVAETLTFARSFDALLLKRATTPRHYEKLPLQNSTVSFDSAVPLPSIDEGPIWAEIEIEKSATGVLLSTLYKPPELALSINLADGRTGTYRLISGIARAGFLISPSIADAKSFAQLSAPEGPTALAGLAIRSFTISRIAGKGPGICYRQNIKLRLYRLKFSAAASTQ